MTDSTDRHDLAERIATSIRDTVDESTQSRRSFLSRSALAGGTLVALGGGTGLAVAAEDEEGNSSDEEMKAMFDDVDGTDVDVVNYALTLEHLENAFYREGQSRTAPRAETAIWGSGETNNLVVVLKAIFTWRLCNSETTE